MSPYKKCKKKKQSNFEGDRVIGGVRLHIGLLRSIQNSEGGCMAPGSKWCRVILVHVLSRYVCVIVAPFPLRIAVAADVIVIVCSALCDCYREEGNSVQR